ncbi:hypothetical protein ENBRE01_1927 [Enteropsectra breve]|nr:hypothetical protein ENBRE01_1927 [Enteropsectra breve]
MCTAHIIKEPSIFIYLGITIIPACLMFIYYKTCYTPEASECNKCSSVKIFIFESLFMEKAVNLYTIFGILREEDPGFLVAFLNLLFFVLKGISIQLKNKLFVSVILISMLMRFFYMYRLGVRGVFYAPCDMRYILRPIQLLAMKLQYARYTVRYIHLCYLLKDFVKIYYTGWQTYYFLSLFFYIILECCQRQSTPTYPCYAYAESFVLLASVGTDGYYLFSKSFCNKFCEITTILKFILQINLFFILFWIKQMERLEKEETRKNQNESMKARL